MRLLFALERASLGGPATRMLGRVRHLARVPGVEVEVAIRRDRGGRALLERHAKVHVADPWLLRAMVESSRYDVVVVVDAPEYLEALGSLERRPPLVAELHADRPEDLLYLGDRRFTVDSFVVPSRYAKRVLHEAELVARHEQLEVAPPVVDPELFFPSPEPKHPRPIIGWVGPVDAREGWRRFLLLASLSIEGGSDVDFWMVGGEHADDPMLDALLESVDGLDLSARVRWFPRLDHGAMRRFYSAVAASHGCTLSTARGATFGSSLVEALLCSCPVVAPNAGALGEVAPGADYLPLYEEMEEAVSAIDALISPAAAGIRARLQSDLDEVRRRFSPQTLGPPYLAMLVRLVEQRRLRSG